MSHLKNTGFADRISAQQEAKKAMLAKFKAKPTVQDPDFDKREELRAAELEAVRAARAAGGEGRFIASRLSDGGTDGAIYDTREDAVRHQLHETQCAYLAVPPWDMPDSEASQWLELAERIYAAGMRLSDPGATPMLTSASTAPLNRAARRRAGREAARHRHPSARKVNLHDLDRFR